MQAKRTALIIGAGPAGLTAALELCRRSSIQPIVFEASDRIGGISCTIRYNGNRIDIGGHRFFSKSDRVMDWWTSLMPVAADADNTVSINHQSHRRDLNAQHTSVECDPEKTDLVMLVRPRKSRIYFQRTFFDYPLSLSAGTIKRLGVLQVLRMGLSYMAARVFPRKPEKSLEDFFINRFGKRLYRTFFKSYTEKVWGVPCNEISAAWGAQRIKGLSLRSAVTHFFKKMLKPSVSSTDIRQKDAETSLIERFLYPKLGPGQMWEHVADIVQQEGGVLHQGWKITSLDVVTGVDGKERVSSIEARSPEGRTEVFHGDYVFSTMPVRELLSVLKAPIPEEIRAISDGLVYRDFITVGLLVDRLLITEADGSLIQDTWIYIQEPDVQLGRLQIFNNWSPYLVSDPSKVWIGLEYFCNDTDPLWKMTDQQIIAFATEEISRIGILNAAEVRDACAFRVPKTYPAYFGTHDRFDEVIRYMERYENLFLVGRNGMHKYNNQDHSMLTAMVSVDNIIQGVTSKANLWEVNTEQEYHETKDGSAAKVEYPVEARTEDVVHDEISA